MSLGLVAWLGTLVYLRWLQAREDALQPVGALHQAYQTQLQGLLKEVDTMTKANQNLASAIAAIPSSSLFLTELAQLTPSDVQLSTASQQGNQLTLSGLAMPPHALRSINAMQLSLENAPLFLRDRVEVAKILEQGAQPGRATTGLSFELKASFAPVIAKVTLPRLQAQGSLGLLRRLRLLDQEGLLP